MALNEGGNENLLSFAVAITVPFPEDGSDKKLRFDLSAMIGDLKQELGTVETTLHKLLSAESMEEPLDIHDSAQTDEHDRPNTFKEAIKEARKKGASRTTGVPDWTLSIGCKSRLHLATQHTKSLVCQLPQTFGCISQSFNFGMGTATLQANEIYQNPMAKAQAKADAGFVRAGLEERDMDDVKVQGLDAFLGGGSGGDGGDDEGEEEFGAEEEEPTPAAVTAAPEPAPAPAPEPAGPTAHGPHHQIGDEAQRDGATSPVGFIRCSDENSLATAPAVLGPVLAMREELSEVVTAFSVPAQLMVIRHEERIRMTDYLKRLTGTVTTPPGELEAANVATPGDLTRRSEASEKSVKCARVIYQALADITSVDHSLKAYLYFKPSCLKKDAALRGVPCNLHLHLYTVMTNDISHVYDINTVGAFAAHCYGMGKGGLHSMHEKLTKLNGQHGDDEIRMKTTDLTFRIEQRMDVVASQALGALTCSFCTKIELNILQGRTDVLENYARAGFLAQFESLVSAAGHEMSMLEDHYIGIQWLHNNVSFQIIDSRKLGRKKSGGKSSPTAEGDSEGGYENDGIGHIEVRDVRQLEFDEPVDVNGVMTDWVCGTKDAKILVVVAVSPWMFEQLPAEIRAGKHIRTHAALFTQGINEWQTKANLTHDGDSAEIQSLINKHGIQTLREYARVLEDPLNKCHHPDKIGQQPGQKLETILTELQQEINQEAAEHRYEKNYEILLRAGDAVRHMDGARFTSCKSAKDRTSMSVTLEQARVLSSYGLQKE
jgi:inositol polyphosphate-4-phosphatase